MSTIAPRQLKLFYCYAREDKVYRDELDRHLSGLKRSQQIASWSDREISPGTEWESTIDRQLNSAHIILLLVSAHFMDSEYCYGKEMKRALERHEKGEARVVSILLRSVDWEDAPFSKLQVLPTDALPISHWPDRDDAFTDIAKALRLVVKELQMALKTKEDWLEEGIALRDLKKHEEALVALDQTIKRDSNDESASINKGVAPDKRKKYEEALAALDQAIKRDSDDESAYFNKGFALDELKRYEEALVALDQVIRLDPESATPYNNKGAALARLKRYEEALVALDQAIKLDLNNANAYINKGFALSNLKRYEEAIISYDEAIKLDPDFATAYHNKGIALRNLGRGAEARGAFEKAKLLGYS